MVEQGEAGGSRWPNPRGDPGGGAAASQGGGSSLIALSSPVAVALNPWGTVGSQSVGHACLAYMGSRGWGWALRRATSTHFQAHLQTQSPLVAVRRKRRT
jgi:hypothetical protein